MNMTPMIDTFTAEFRKSMHETCDFSGEVDLNPAIAARFFAALGQSISRAACLGTEHFLRSHDVDEPFVIKDGVKLNAAGTSIKEYVSPFGPISLERCNYQAHWGGETYQPLDEKWGMVGEFATEPVRECVMFHMAHMSPNETVACLDKSSLFQISKTAIDNILTETGERTEASFDYLHKAILAETPVPENADVLVCSMDGANILTREPGKKKGRPKEGPQSEDEQKTVPQSSYRNAMVGAFSFYEAGNGEEPPNRLGASYIARTPEPNFTSFKENFEREFFHRDAQMSDDSIRILLHDGGRNIWNYCDSTPQYNSCLKLPDYYHATEHLANATESIFGKKSKKSNQWFDKWKRKLKESDNGVVRLIDSIKYYQPKVRGKTRLSALEKELTFFRRNATRMKYKSFLDKGLPIGSGPVESNCKVIVKQRLCKSGQRWSLKGAQHVLHLRAIVKSGNWEIYWKKHEEMRLKEVA